MAVTGQGVSVSAIDWGGTREPGVVLLPGFGATRSLVEVAARLGGRRVITADLRGHGRSTSGPWSFAAAEDDLAAVVDAFSLEAPAVVEVDATHRLITTEPDRVASAIREWLPA